MSVKLHDPNLPADAIFKPLKDGGVLLNNNVPLRPANQNRWYVLATVYGEQDANPQEGGFFDEALHARNRRIWNGWMCQGMDEAERAKLARQMKLPVADLAELEPAERAVLDQALAERLRKEVILSPDKRVNLRETYFSRMVAWKDYVFRGDADFGSSIFGSSVNFESAIFKGHSMFGFVEFLARSHFKSVRFEADAFFLKTKFGAGADFSSARFARDASFAGTTFDSTAKFKSARFCGPAGFGFATFSGPADFESARFRGPADFSGGAFEGTTKFGCAKFKTHAPKFFQRAMHQDTTFTTERDNWPGITDENAEDAKNAYQRLALMMRELNKPDDEQFFLREEVRCKAVLARGVPEKLGWWLYRGIADYGGSFERPAAWLLGLWLLGVAGFAGYFTSPGAQGLDPDVLSSPVGTAMALSFGSLFAFLGINRLYFSELLQDMPDPLQFLAGLETVAGFILLFFLGLGLRNRFRLK